MRSRIESQFGYFLFVTKVLQCSPLLQCLGLLSHGTIRVSAVGLSTEYYYMSMVSVDDSTLQANSWPKSANLV